MSETIQILSIAVLAVTFFAVVRLYRVLGNVRQTLTNLETTRIEISNTLQRLETVATTTQKVLDEEVAPTLKVARETLVNVEITTRALADTTLAIRRLTGKVESVASAQQLIKVGGPLLQQVAKRSVGAVSGLLTGIGAGVRAVLGRRKSVPVPQNMEPVETVEPQKALPAPEPETKLEPVSKSPSRKASTGARKR